MNSASKILFTPYKLGPVTLRNRTIRAAAFAGLSFPHQLLLNQTACIMNDETISQKVKDTML